MFKNAGIWSLVLPALITGILGSCTDRPAALELKNKMPVAPAKSRYMQKPPSHFRDTMWINGAAAVFFYPDTAQLAAISTGLDTMVYRGIMHDYHYQVHYCHSFLRSEWPGLQIKEANHCRYLVFTSGDQTEQCIDLDARPDMYGLFVTNGYKKPIQVDMTNIITQVSFYLSNGKG
jgi:hypothetical protein